MLPTAILHTIRYICYRNSLTEYIEYVIICLLKTCSLVFNKINNILWTPFNQSMQIL